MTKLEKVLVESETSRIEADEDDLAVGQWYWTETTESKKKHRWLGCITEIGSNYVEVTQAGERYNSTYRFHIEEEFDAHCVERVLDPTPYINGRIEEQQHKVRSLMGEVKALCAKFGLTPRGELAAGSDDTSNALVVAHGASDIQAHKKALIKAKEKTLPDLFEKIKEANEEMSSWMKAALIPMRAEIEGLKEQTAKIEDRIFTVELYAGLSEELVLIRDGQPADNGEKIHLFQRRHYMDEESLLDYKAGGMDFKGIEAFDRWLMKKKNRSRILPLPKCVVAFQVRRKEKEREARALSDFIAFSKFKEYDKWTYLYIRNGDRYYRLSTTIDFGEHLFPDASHSKLLAGGQLFTKYTGGFYHDDDIITEHEFWQRQQDFEVEKKKYKEELAAWKKLSDAQKKKTCRPHFWREHDLYFSNYEKLDQDNVYYDDAMKIIAKAARDHNRVAVVLQGLLDRSPAFHPHPPWRLWEPEGFTNALELHYDDSRGLTDGDAPDFEAYRDRLNAGITKGTRTVGQEYYWMRVEAEKENERQANDWRIKYRSDYKLYRPYGNEGPGLIAEVVGMSRDKKQAKFTWERERQTTKWVRNPDRPGYLMPDPSGIACHLKVPVKVLLNVDAYTPGDYLQFYQDPRTRQDYLKWAPLLLACEDFYAQKRKKRG